MMREPITQQIAAIILESETYLNIYNTPKNIIANISSKIGFTPKTTPALVATAFPPLNLRYMDIHGQVLRINLQLTHV